MRHMVGLLGRRVMLMTGIGVGVMRMHGRIHCRRCVLMRRAASEHGGSRIPLHG